MTKTTRKFIIYISKIPKLPKLKVSTVSELQHVEYFLDFEQAKNIVFGYAIVLVEGHRVISYDELVKLASQEMYRNREFLKVELVPIEVAGGG